MERGYENSNASAGGISVFSRGRGYIFIETVVAMAVLSVSAMVIYEALRQAALVRAQAEDFTVARFLLERVLAEHALPPLQQENEGQGQFDPPFDRFSYAWKVSQVEVPEPEWPTDLTQEELAVFRAGYQKYLGKVEAVVRWTRGGSAFEARAETLVNARHVWVPPEPGQGFP
ncbi:MAG TPA: hypothetical protein PLX03_02895 [Candidatus Hydrogenedentes bacterium]|nr:hypothetical protein [Candidatus Hydrogenedentota bacterium]